MDNRIVGQNAQFTVHPNPYEPWYPEGLTTIKIHLEVRKEIKWVLNNYGIHAATVFPDLGGIAQQIKYLRSDYH